MLYIIYVESANYAGHGQHFVVEAKNVDRAKDLAIDFIEDYFYEQDNDQLAEDYEDEDDYGVYGTIVWAQEFGPDHDCWQYYQDPGQAEFYIKVNVD